MTDTSRTPKDGAFHTPGAAMSDVAKRLLQHTDRDGEVIPIFAEAAGEIERLRSINADMLAALEAAKQFLGGMRTPAQAGILQISSYHPLQALLDKINPALTKARGDSQ